MVIKVLNSKFCSVLAPKLKLLLLLGLFGPQLLIWLCC